MKTSLRIWRVVPTSKTGVQAPAFFVETIEEDRSKAEIVAKKLAEGKSRLSNFDCWKLNLTRMSVRIDKFGRYVKHHQ